MITETSGTDKRPYPRSPRDRAQQLLSKLREALAESNHDRGGRPLPFTIEEAIAAGREPAEVTGR